MGEFVMPSLGADMEAGTLVAWKRGEGDRVQRGDIIAEVETDKGTIEVEVWESGVVQRLLVEEGQKVPVGTPLAVIGEAGAEAGTGTATESATETVSAPASPSAPAPAPAPDSVHASPSARRLAHELDVDLEHLRGTGRHGTVTRTDVQRAVDGVIAPAGQELAPKPSPAARPRVSPAARKRARELGVDPTRIEPSAPDGAVHLADVERAAAEAPTATQRQSPTPETQRPAPADKAPGERMRRAIAAAMARSKREIPHYYLGTTVDLTPALEWIEAANVERSVSERLLAGVLFLKAVALALRDVPELNSRWEGDGATQLDRIHVGVAVSLRGGGLIAPAIHDTDEKDLDALMVAFKDLVKRARTGALRASEMADGTITVTSLGDRGVETVYPVIYPPQVAIVGFGRVVERPWVVDGELEARSVVDATLAGDHRVSDGHRGGLFLAAVADKLRSPEAL